MPGRGVDRKGQDQRFAEAWTFIGAVIAVLVLVAVVYVLIIVAEVVS